MTHHSVIRRDSQFKGKLNGASWRRSWCVMTHCVNFAVLGSFGTHDFVSPKGAFMMSYPIYRIILSPQKRPIIIWKWSLDIGYPLRRRKERKPKREFRLWRIDRNQASTPVHRLGRCIRVRYLTTRGGLVWRSDTWRSIRQSNRRIEEREQAWRLAWYGTRVKSPTWPEKKRKSNQPFVCHQFGTGNCLSLYASFYLLCIVPS